MNKTINSIILLSGVLLLAVSNWISLGMYNIIFTPIFIIGLLLATYSLTANCKDYIVSPNIIAFIAAVFFVLMIINPSIIYADLSTIIGFSADRALKIALILAATISFILTIINKQRKEKLWNGLAWSVLTLSIFGLWMVIKISPIPKIDVFVINTLGADSFLSGKNPYSHIYPDIYNGAYGYHPGYTYWPFYLLFSLIPRILGDIRFTTLFSLIIIIICIVGIGKKYSLKTNSLSVMILLVSLPAWCFVTEQAWIDTLLLAGLAVVAWSLTLEMWWVSAFAMGCVIATKQYGVIAVLPTLVLWRELLGTDKTARLMAVMVITALSILVPFVLMDWKSFYHNTIELLVIIPSRDDSLSIPALIKHLYGVQIPGAILLCSYSLVAVVIAIWQWKQKAFVKAWMTAVALSYGWIFILGKQAFSNYHQFATGLIILCIAMPVVTISNKEQKV